MSDRSLQATKSLRRHQLFGVLVLVLLVGGLGGWSAFANISGAVIAPSVVVVESNAKQVQHLEGGIVAEINVRDGQQVKAGDVLLRLDETETKANLGILDAQLTDQLARLARLRAERDGEDNIDFSLDMALSVAPSRIATARRDQRQLFRSRQNTVRGEAEQIEQRIAQFDEEIRGLQAQKKSRQTQLGFLKDELDGLRDLYQQGLVPKRRMLALERQFAETEGERGQYTSDMARARGRIAELRVQAAQSKRERTNQILTELRAVEASVAELLERRTAAQNRLSRVAIHAPRDGFVHNLSVHTIGGVIAPRDPIMAIIPEKDALELEARVNPSDIHRIFREQKVIIRFSSLDAARTPEQDGTITRIPAAATQQANGQRPPEYIVRIGFSDGEFDKLDGQTLKPGMPAEVYIETGDRKAISFLLKPVIDALPTVFRGE